MPPSLFGQTIPWQTSDEQVGAYAFCDGLGRLGALAGFVYVPGCGPNAAQTKDNAQHHPGWQFDKEIIESHLGQARTIIRRYRRRLFRSHDRFGDACRVLDQSWVPQVNAQLLGYYVDTLSLSLLGKTPHGIKARYHYVFIRISKSNQQTPNKLAPTGSTATVIAVAPVPASPTSPPSQRLASLLRKNGESSKASTRSARAKTKAVDPEPAKSVQPPMVPMDGSVKVKVKEECTTTLQQQQQEEERSVLLRKLDMEQARCATQMVELQRMEHLWRQQVQRADQYAQQTVVMNQLQSQLQEEHAKSKVLTRQVEELLKQLREERMRNEQFAEHLGNVEQQLRRALAEIALLMEEREVDKDPCTSSSILRSADGMAVSVKVPAQSQHDQGSADNSPKKKKKKSKSVKTTQKESVAKDDEMEDDTRNKMKKHKKKSTKHVDDAVPTKEKVKQKKAKKKKTKKRSPLPRMTEDGIGLNQCFFTAPNNRQEVLDGNSDSDKAVCKDNTERTGGTDLDSSASCDDDLTC